MIRMDSLLLILFCVGFSAASLSIFGSAYGAFQPSENYIIEAQGFSISEKTIDSSLFDISFLTSTSGEKINIQVIDASIFFQRKDLVFSKFDISILRDGKFLRLVGVSEDPQGNELTLRLFGRLMGTSSDASVYEFKGKLDYNNELYNLHFVGKTQTEMKIPQVSSEILDSEEKPQTEMKISEPIIGYTSDLEPVTKQIQEIKMTMLGDASYVVPLKDKFQFQIRVYDEKLNPSRDKHQRSGFLTGVDVTVQIFDRKGLEVWSISGQTDDNGYYFGFWNMPNDNRLLGKYDVKYTLEYQGNTLVYDNFFYAQETTSGKIMKPLKDFVKT